MLAPEDRGDQPAPCAEFKESAERAFLSRSSARTTGIFRRTAEAIGTPRSNLYKKLEQYNIRQDVDS